MVGREIEGLARARLPPAALDELGCERMQARDGVRRDQTLDQQIAVLEIGSRCTGSAPAAAAPEPARATWLVLPVPLPSSVPKGRRLGCALAIAGARASWIGGPRNVTVRAAITLSERRSSWLAKARRRRPRRNARTGCDSTSVPCRWRRCGRRIAPVKRSAASGDAALEHVRWLYARNS